MRGISRPILSDVRFQFAGGGQVEVFPVLTSNLYLDKALVLYGRYPRNTEGVVFQVTGDAGKTRCDMVFDLALDSTAKSRDEEIRILWAKQKLYHLLGQYARSPDKALYREIKQTARAYGVRIPHKGRFGSGR